MGTTKTTKSVDAYIADGYSSHEARLAVHCDRRDVEPVGDYVTRAVACARAAGVPVDPTSAGLVDLLDQLDAAEAQSAAAAREASR